MSIYLLKTATETNLSQMQVLLGCLHKLVGNGLNARLICEQILSCEKLSYKNQVNLFILLFICKQFLLYSFQSFWIESFQLIRKIIGGVDYKGVREIMKACREKANNFPYNLTSSVLPQMTALCDVLEYIFNRNSCLLPAYFIITEIMKPLENNEVHWVNLRLI